MLIGWASTVTFQQVFQTRFRSFCCGSVQLQLFNFRLLRQNEQSYRMRNANRISELWRLPVGRLLITVMQSTKNSNLKTSTRFEINLINLNRLELSERLYLFTHSIPSIRVGSTSLIRYFFTVLGVWFYVSGRSRSWENVSPSRVVQRLQQGIIYVKT